MQNKELNASGAKSVSSKEIEKKRDELVAESEKLQAELSKFKFIDFSILFVGEQYDQSPELKKAIGEWLAQVRGETDYLKPLDVLGIQIFQDDLSIQPAFPDVEIMFGSEEVHKHNLSNPHAMKGGWAETRKRGAIKIQEAEWNQKGQAGHFLETGRLPDSVVSMIHELIHWAHYMRSTRSRVDSVLTESHAFITSEVYRNQSDLSQIHEILVNLPIYNFEKEKSMLGLLNVADLQALGISESDLAALIAESAYDDNENKFLLIEKKLKELRGESQWAEADTIALRELYSLNRANQGRKAQLMLYETLKSHFGMERLKEDRRAGIREHIAIPHYFHKGIKVPSDELFQSIVLPANDEWPYDPEGIRAGVAFGFFENDKGEFQYQLGKLLMTPQDSTFTPATVTEEQETLLSILRQQASQLKSSNKRHFLHNAYHIGCPDLTMRVMLALISKEEAGQFIKEDKGKYEKSISTMQSSLMPYIKLGYIPPRDRGAVKAMVGTYERMQSSLSRLLNAYGSGEESLDSNLESKLRDFGEGISKLKFLYDREFGELKSQ